MKRRLILLFLCFSILQLSAQSEKSAFDNSLTAYKNGNYQTAQSGFFKLLQDFPEGRFTTATRLMLAKSYYKLGDYANTEIICNYFFTKHPNSTYMDDMRHLLGNTRFQQRQYDAAVSEWNLVINSTRDPRLKKISTDYTFSTMKNYYGRSQLERAQRSNANPTTSGLATIILAETLIQEGAKPRAQSMLQDFVSRQPNHPYIGRAQRLLGGQSVTSGGGSSSGDGFLFLKPEQGDTREIADEIELGMRYALLEYEQRNPGKSILLQTATVGETVISALNVTNQQILDSNPLCLIGPVDSDQCAGLSLLSRYEKMPYVIPLSSQAGLTKLSSYSFQINPDVATKGRFLANYATRDLKAKRIAVLAPVNEYGEGFVNSFIEEVQAAGGEVVTYQRYYETTQDFTRQFRNIRRAGFFATYKDSILERYPDMTDKQLNRNFRQHMDKRYDRLNEFSRRDTTDLASTGIDALLMIVRSPDFIQYIANQIPYNNIKTRLLGNEGWNDSAQLRKYRNQLEGLTYITAGYYDPNSWNYKGFMNRFRESMKTTPDLFHLLGYDIMKWIITNYRKGMTRDQLRDNLERSGLYQGILESIQFTTTPRVNSNLTLLKLNLGQIIKLN
ncbi:MAG: ABC transporter substrate-binding protein [Calditrichia bacterium]